MKQAIQQLKYVSGVALALALLAGSSLAAPPTTTFDLTGVGTGSVLAGVYTSPYSGSVTGPAGTTIPVICDDFADDSYVPEQWTAYVTSLSSLTSGTPDTYLKWLNTPGSTITVDGDVLNQASAYTVAAVLAIDILTSTGEAQEDYSYAMWELFDAPAAFAQLTAYGDTSDEATANNDLNAAVTNVETNGLTPADYTNVTIYSFDSAAGAPTCNGGPCPNSPPQEFITVNMDEASALPELALYLVLCAGGLFFIGRRRILGAAR